MKIPSISIDLLKKARHSPLNIASACGTVAVLISISGCATTAKTPEYLHTGSHTGTTGRQIESTLSINREKSYRIYFTVSQPEKCIKVKITSKRNIPESVYVVPPVYTYFVVEKAIDLRPFVPAKEQYIFSEIGRNYDGNWNMRGETEICTDPADPLKKIDKGIYRIRFSVLENTAVDFKITLYSNNGEIIFLNDLPESAK